MRFVAYGFSVISLLFGLSRIEVLAAESISTVAIVADESGYCISGNLQGQPDEDLIEQTSSKVPKYEMTQQFSFRFSDVFQSVTWGALKLILLGVSFCCTFLSIVCLELKKGQCYAG